MHYLLLLLNVESTFENEIVLIGKVEQLATLELFPLCKLNLEDKGTGGANENASRKNYINFIIAPSIYVIQKWLHTGMGWGYFLVKG